MNMNLQFVYTHRAVEKQVCVQPRPSAVNVTLPAFATVRRAAVP